MALLKVWGCRKWAKSSGEAEGCGDVEAVERAKHCRESKKGYGMARMSTSCGRYGRMMVRRREWVDAVWGTVVGSERSAEGVFARSRAEIIILNVFGGL